MRFLTDMGVDVRIVQWLREQGHDAAHLRDKGLHCSPNGKIFAKAVAENRVALSKAAGGAEVMAGNTLRNTEGSP